MTRALRILTAGESHGIKMAALIEGFTFFGIITAGQAADKVVLEKPTVPAAVTAPAH